MNESVPGEFVISRSRDGGRISGSSQTLGGQPDWFWGVPGVFRALSNPIAGERVPALPIPGAPHAQSLGYWGALQYLLLRRLAWSRPDRGLRWWYENGKPTADPTLRLISEVWDSDGALDIYLAWLLQKQFRFDLETPGTAWGDWSDPEELSRDWREWLDEFSGSARSNGFEWFGLGGGWDPLHLSGHLGESGAPDQSSHLSIPEGTDRIAVFVTSTMDAWYCDLLNKATDLPMIGNKSWKVDVFVKPVGFLGTYRRSSQTGLWFTGRHRYHSVGN